MMPLLQLFWNICLMREGPERVPEQNFLIALTLALKIIVILTVTRFLDVERNVLQLVTEIVVAATITSLLVAACLELKGLRNRFAATLGALFGSDLILTSLFATVLSLVTAFSMSPNFASYLFTLWSMFIAGFIMHKALDTTFLMGFGVGMIILLISVSVAEQI